MFSVSEKYKNEIDKLGGRSFVSKVVIRDKEYNDDVIIDMSLNESVNPGDNFSLGSIASNTFEINLINVDTSVIFKEATVKPYIGLKFDDGIEYIPLGVFTVDNVTIKDKKVKLECVDNMIELEKAYFSDLKYPCNINEILKEICTKANIKCNSLLPDYSIDEIKGYSFRQAVGVLATLSGCFVRFNRGGELEITSYKDVGVRITPDTFFKFEKNDKDYIIGKITAKNGDKNFSKGSNTEIIIDNPVITEDIVNDLYNKFKDFTYRPYTLSWQGNPAIQAGDRIAIVDLDGKEYNTLIMEQKLTYNGGIKSELKASGKTESSDRFDSKGPVTQAMENYSIEQAAIKVALIKKADIDSLDAVDARINNLYTQDLTALKANIKDLQSNKISTVEFNALESKLQHALIGKADVNELNVAVERVGILEGKTLSVENQLAGNLTAKNFKANSITAGSAIIAENAIGSSQISSLSVNKVEAGDISTSKFRIISANGSIQIVGNQILINRDNINRVILGEYIKQDNTTDYGLLIRAKDGTTVMFDGEGVHNAGITDGAIDNNKVADNANISGNKLDINSVIREVNGATETIAGTKIQVGDRTLDVELSTQKNTITEQGKELSTQKATIQALDNAIKLKVDNQTFIQSTAAINGNINNINSDLIGKINTSLNNAKSYADSSANNALNSANAYTTAQITTTNSNLSKATSEINILKEQISTKVGQTDIDKSIHDIKIGGRNLLHNSNMVKDLDFNSATPNIRYELVNSNEGVSSLYGGRLLFINTPNNFGDSYVFTGLVVKNIIPNSPYTLSFDYWGAGDYEATSSYLRVKVNGKYQYMRISHEPIYNKVRKRYNQIFTFPEGTTEVEVRVGMFTTYYAWMCFDGFKFEEGKFATSYTQDPEDTDQLIIDNIKVVTNKINDVSSNLIQVKDSLQASVNSLNSTTQTITTNLTNTTNNLTNKINIAKTDAINDSKSYADSVVASKSNEALNNANNYTNAQITTVNSRVNNAESSINVLRNQINTKVSQTDIDKSISNIKFGDRNLAINSDFRFGWRDWGFNNPGNNGEVEIINDDTFGKCAKVTMRNTNQGIYQGFKRIKGKVYSWSVWIKANKPGTLVILHEQGEGSKNINLTTEWTRYTGTGIWNGPGGSLCFYSLNGTDELVVYISNLKYVEGNTISISWTAAPEDVNQEIKDNTTTVTEKINTVESTLTQKTNNINAAVSSVQSILNTKADGSTVSNMQSQLASLNIGLDGIKTEVAKKTDKGSIISEINQSSESVKINASKIELNGVTTFSDSTGLKAIEIQNNSVDLYNFNNNGELVGSLTSVVQTANKSKPGVELVNYKNSFLDIGYFDSYLDSGASSFKSYIIFDKYKVREEVCPISIYEDVCFNGCQIFLDVNKGNSFFESTSGNFIIKAKHGVQIEDTDTGNITALLGADRTAFSKWNQNFYYAEFFPGGFNFVGNDGKSVFWLNDGSWDIWTKAGVNMRVQGDLSVRGSKNRIVETSIGDLALNAVESTECWFTDILIEESRTDANGDCIILFDNKFLQTVNTRYKYKIDATPIGEFASNGELTYVRVVEKTEKYFKVRGTPNTLFDWTITAKQIGYENIRLEKVEKAS